MNRVYALMFIVLLTATLFAQIPRTLSYQGILTDNSGNPKSDGNYNVSFSFYEQSTGGTAMWTETKSLTVAKGLFSTSLGDQTPFGNGLKFNKQYWLGITVGADPELLPRISLNAAGYSFSSINSDTANNIINGKVVESINGLKDNITLKGSGGTTITSTGDTISVSSTGTGGTGIQGVQNTNNTIDIINPNGPTATANLKVPLTLSGIINYPNYLISAISTGTGNGIQGVGQSGIGVVGAALGTSGVNYGVAGNTYSPTGYAVSGWNLATTGDAVGIIGKTNSPTGIGVFGQSSTGIGIEGKITSDGGIAIYGNTPNGSHSWAGFFEGYVNVSATLYVGDLLVTGSKNFQIDHPLDPENKFLVHSSIESPDRKSVV